MLLLLRKGNTLWVYVSVCLHGCFWHSYKTQTLKAKTCVFNLRNIYPCFQKRSKSIMPINPYLECKNMIVWKALKIKWQFHILSSWRWPYCFRRMIRNVISCVCYLFELEIWVLNSIWDLILRWIILKKPKYSNFFFSKNTNTW